MAIPFRPRTSSPTRPPLSKPLEQRYRVHSTLAKRRNTSSLTFDLGMLPWIFVDDLIFDVSGTLIARVLNVASMLLVLRECGNIF
jgi:hypothetical protein